MKGAIAMLLDETGSMDEPRGKKAEVLEAVNTYIDSMRDLGDEIAFILTKFNTREIVTLEPVPISGAPLLESEHYQPNYSTPLYDSILQTVEATKKRGFSKVFFVIQTDGHENASKHATLEQVKKVIEAQQTAGWEFVFLGEGPDAWGVGLSMGVAAGQSTHYEPTRASRLQAYAGTQASTRKYFK